MKKKLYSIQILRGIAALLVVSAHAVDYIQSLHKPSWLCTSRLENFGAVGVDIFFVISGFIMAVVTKNSYGWKDTKKFLYKRIVRIYALYIPVLLVTFLFQADFNVKELVHQTLKIKDFILLPIFDSKTEFTRPTIFVTWTLAFEMLFYLIIAFPMLLLKSFHLKISAIIVLLLSFIGYIFHFKDTQILFLTNPIILEFVLGLVIGLMYNSTIVVSYWISIPILVSSILLFFLGIHFGFGSIDNAHGTINGTESIKRFIYWGIPSALLIASVVFIEKATGRAIFFIPVLVLIGDASYAIYLTHSLLFSKIYNLFPFAKQLNGDLLIAFLMVMATLFAILLHKYFEQKVLSIFSNIVTL